MCCVVVFGRWRNISFFDKFAVYLLTCGQLLLNIKMKAVKKRLENLRRACKAATHQQASHSGVGNTPVSGPTRFDY